MPSLIGSLLSILNHFTTLLFLFIGPIVITEGGEDDQTTTIVQGAIRIMGFDLPKELSLVYPTLRETTLLGHRFFGNVSGEVLYAVSFYASLTCRCIEESEPR